MKSACNTQNIEHSSMPLADTLSQIELNSSRVHSHALFAKNIWNESIIGRLCPAARLSLLGSVPVNIHQFAILEERRQGHPEWRHFIILKVDLLPLESP
jgi:hypothetical protein